MPGCTMRTLPFSALHDVMLTMFVCATYWLSMHLYTLAYTSMHESYLLVCCPFFNTKKLWTFNPNLHLSLVNTTYCLLSCLFAFLLVCLLSCFFACFTCMLVCFIPIAHYLRNSFFPLLVYGFLVFAFPCTHMERGCMELGHSLPGANKKGEDASTWI